MELDTTLKPQPQTDGANKETDEDAAMRDIEDMLEE